MKAGFFTRDFLTSLPSDNLEASVAIIDEFTRRFEDSDYSKEDLKDYLEAYAIFCTFIKARKMDIQISSLDGLVNWREIENHVYSFVLERGKVLRETLAKRTTETILSDTEAEYTGIFSSEQTYEFSDKDIQHVQKLTDELRTLISSSTLIDDQHKRRLLRRLEAMQRELHKHTSDIDRFWGFVAEAGIVSRKFGEDMKPISDRVFELGKIVLAVILAKEGVHALPEITKLFLPE